ncbi:winged helix-turn-helix transcriptional regulator [Streptomyces sp. PSKA54]|uniref:Winged helix-turn-helix transcriptional regulator n=1 Tax=Streptomyces himalayensis subsp. aureolus TaxID=2758039 RepID=A0A7W2CXD9_9ACTN|nr:MarR family winged helix-turn-helix transcriptional regulator [Streptomyces himalayensis]MBA4860843.1 winged helix-turn-helix transcriptional regulator [Streptomyces himalayensis subsp. aureolus]
MAENARWLNAEENRAWRAFLRTRRLLGARLNQQLLRDWGLSEPEYEILVVLSEHPDRRMTSLELRCRLLWEKSRLSHQLRRMELRCLISRAPNPDDARSAIVSLTAEGLRAIEQAAPSHVANVREHFIDFLSQEELAILTEICERVVDHLVAGGELSVPEGD